MAKPLNLPIVHTHLPHTHLFCTHSTNSQMIAAILTSKKMGENSELLGEPMPHFSRPHLLTADTQTNGRGQHGRHWQSPTGNVYLSLYVPTIPTAEFAKTTDYQLTQRLDGRLSLCVGYYLSQLPELKSLQKIGVKWVNDLGFYTKHISDGSANSPQTQRLTFNKLAGILLEPVTLDNKLLGVVIGVGMNIAFTPTLTAPNLTTQTQDSLTYQAVSLQDLIGGNLNPHDFYSPISRAILQAVQQFNGFSEPSKVAEFLQDFSHIDILLGKNLQITLPTGEVRVGKAYGIDTNGCLQILQNDSTITPIWTGTIQVL